MGQWGAIKLELYKLFLLLCLSWVYCSGEKKSWWEKGVEVLRHTSMPAHVWPMTRNDSQTWGRGDTHAGFGTKIPRNELEEKDQRSQGDDPECKVIRSPVIHLSTHVSPDFPEHPSRSAVLFPASSTSSSCRMCVSRPAIMWNSSSVLRVRLWVSSNLDVPRIPFQELSTWHPDQRPKYLKSSVSFWREEAWLVQIYPPPCGAATVSITQ